jgi:four helix bundle protein
MAKVSRFEDLIVWQKARELTKKIYSMSSSGALSHDFGLRDQLRRASVSIMSNIAEGFERETTTDYLRFLVMAQGSCSEVRCQLYVALDAGYLDQTQFSVLMDATKEIGRMLAGLRASLKP